jgi:hypothetical protein
MKLSNLKLSNLDFQVGQSSNPAGFTWHFRRPDVFTLSEETARWVSAIFSVSLQRFFS